MIDPRIARLPSHGGWRVPYFASWIDGRPEFRVVDPAKIRRALKEHLCWICGQPLGRTVAFAIGPMCTVNRLSAEPPQHRDCAIYAATTCPFLTDPEKERRTSRLPEGASTPDDAPGIMLTRNPGVVAVWITRFYQPEMEPNGVLFRLGAPLEVLWYHRGRAATRAEVQAAIASGLPKLQELAELDGPEAMEMCAQAVLRAGALLPKATPGGQPLA
jgi:hypothetical protein